MYKLYFKGKFLSEHPDYEGAEAAARWAYFEYQSYEWEGQYMPPGFFIACEGGKANAA